MSFNVVIILIGLGGMGIFSCIVMAAIALSHYPFTLKDLFADFREICKALYEGENPKSKGDLNHGKHRKERDHHH